MTTKRTIKCVGSRTKERVEEVLIKTKQICHSTPLSIRKIIRAEVMMEVNIFLSTHATNLLFLSSIPISLLHVSPDLGFTSLGENWTRTRLLYDFLASENGFQISE